MSVLLSRTALSALVFAAACADSTEAPTARPTAPADWPTYTEPEGRFSLRYPSDWYRSEGGGFYSYDVNSDTGPSGQIRPNEVKVEANVFETSGRTVCGSLKVDTSGEVDSIEAQATKTTLGGQPAREIVRGDPDPPTTLIRGISLVHEGNCILLIAYYTEETPDELPFAQIADSFEIHF
jgi:hypothetical protein